MTKKVAVSILRKCSEITKKVLSIPEEVTYLTFLLWKLGNDSDIVLVEEFL